MSLNSMNFLTITEKAAINVFPFIGKKDKRMADDAATQSMRKELGNMKIEATVIIGEGEMDNAPMLYIGEKLGKGGEAIDIAVDPLDGTILTSKGQNGAITVLALSSSGSFLNAPDMYMKKIATGKQAKGLLDIKKSLTENIHIYSQASHKPLSEIVVAMLDRERHHDYMKEVIEVGAKLQLLSDGDILPAILTGIEKQEPDILYGIGAAPEGIISAAALKALGGDFQGILMPENEEQVERCKSMGIVDPKTQVFKLLDLVKKDDIQVVITAVTNGVIGQGVHSCLGNIVTHSLKISSQEPKVQFIKSIY